ncbi:MAG: hypothetical protein AB8I69_24195 [Anaerolineae bacterium]
MSAQFQQKPDFDSEQQEHQEYNPIDPQGPAVEPINFHLNELLVIGRRAICEYTAQLATGRG